MIQIDRFTKIILTVIALLLLALLIRGRGDMGVQSSAYAQAKTTILPTRPSVEVVNIKDIPVKNFQEVILLGDGKTFLVRVDSGIAVFQVQEFFPRTTQ